MRHLLRGGRYLRVADPGWTDPLSGAHARRRGGRWNPPGAFDVVYLNRSPEVARAQVQRKLAPLGIGPEDLEPSRAPVLVHIEVPRRSFVDAVSERGVISLGLPPSYPLDRSGEAIGHETCQPIGLAAKSAGESGVACRSAAADPSPGEELAYFEAGLRADASEPFEQWFWPGARGEDE